MKNIAISVGAIVLVGLGIWAVLTYGGNESAGIEQGEAVAVVNGEEISRAEYDAFQARAAEEQNVDISTLDAETQESFKTQTIDSLVSQTLLRQAVAASGISVSDEEVDAQIELLKGQFETEAAYEQALIDEGVSEDELRTQIKTNLAIEPYLEQELNLSAVTATEAEVAATHEQVSAGQEVPPLAEVYAQIEEMTVQQKHQQLIAQHVETLRANAEIEVLI